MKNSARGGFEYVVETVRNGQVVGIETVHNLLPTEGVNYLIDAALKAGTAYPKWYMGLFEGAYTPVPEDTMSTFPGAAAELLTYSQIQRPGIVFGGTARGGVDNSGSKAEFTGSVDGKLVRGGFICSAPAKGATTGVLLSAVRFYSPKTLDAGTILRVTGGFSITST